MNSTALRANLLDASALVKLYVNEDGSDTLRNYVQQQPTRYTTPFCFYEALNVLKVKWRYKNKITQEEYRNATFALTQWFSASSRQIRDLDFTNPTVFRDVQTIAQKYDTDLSDAFQILSIKNGFFSPLAGDSRTILVTADEKLANIARQENILVWYLMAEPVP